MSLDKAIESGRERREPHRGSAVWDAGCRNHGKCGYCQSNRTIRDQRLRDAETAMMDEFLTGGDADDGEQDFLPPSEE